MSRQLILLILFMVGLMSCKSPEGRLPISRQSGSFIDESVKRNKLLHQKEANQFKALMDQHPEHHYIASTNGFWYYYNTKVESDTLPTPQFGDIVSFNYNIKSINGTLIYSKEDIKTQNYAMDQQELFTGMRQGLKLMKAGETVTFLFPSDQAFGYYGDTKKIGTNVPIICETTINSITKNENH